MKWLLDTNILIDFLNGRTQARDTLSDPAAVNISLVSWMEVLVGATEPEEAATLRRWLQRFEILEIDRPVAERAVQLRREHRLRLPDAIIWASAQVHGQVLVSRNTRDFARDTPGVHVPYTL